MAVHGDGKANRPPGYRGLVPESWPSIRQTNGWQAGEISEAGAKVAFLLLLDAGSIICGCRFCFMCNADLGDAGVPHQSSTPAGYKAATGIHPEWTLAIPRGGHAPDCPVPYLLRWAGQPDSPYTRVRTLDIDNDAAKLLTAAKSPMELVGTQVELLSDEERSARADVLRGFGYTSEAE